MDITKEKNKQLKEFEKKLGYKFKHRDLLFCALTHKSFTNEMNLPASENNERLEFLGDAVLELSVSHMLFEKYPDKPEGDLSKIRAAVVNEDQLAKLAVQIDMGNDLILGKGEDNTGGREKSSILSDAFEAVLGAIYLDRGFEKAFKIVRRFWTNLIEEAGSEGYLRDYKTRLQEVFQSRFKRTPHYRLVKQSGPEHSKIFEIEVYLDSELMGRGLGMSKKAAEQCAAKEVLDKLEKD